MPFFVAINNCKVETVERNNLKFKIGDTVHVNKKSFSKNSVLNDVLNETAVSSPPISSDNSTYPNMENKVYTTDDMSTMMNGGDETISIDGKTPDFLQKDFKSILDKSIQKSNQKQGM